MRTLAVLAAATVALALSGCDINTSPRTAKAECGCCSCPTQAAPPTRTAATPPMPDDDMRGSDAYEPRPYRRHHHRGYDRYRPHRDRGYSRWNGHSYYWRREYSEMSIYTYDYRSASTSTYVGATAGAAAGASAYAYAGAGAGAYAGAGAGASTGGGYRVVPGGWQDGYGRWHDGRATAGDPAHYEPTGSGDGGSRMQPWHGYDADCPDDDHDHHGHQRP